MYGPRGVRQQDEEMLARQISVLIKSGRLERAAERYRLLENEELRAEQAELLVDALLESFHKQHHPDTPIELEQLPSEIRSGFVHCAKYWHGPLPSHPRFDSARALLLEFASDPELCAALHGSRDPQAAQLARIISDDLSVPVVVTLNEHVEGPELERAAAPLIAAARASADPNGTPRQSPALHALRRSLSMPGADRVWGTEKIQQLARDPARVLELRWPLASPNHAPTRGELELNMNKRLGALLREWPGASATELRQELVIRTKDEILGLVASHLHQALAEHGDAGLLLDEMPRARYKQIVEQAGGKRELVPVPGPAFLRAVLAENNELVFEGRDPALAREADLEALAKLLEERIAARGG